MNKRVLGAACIISVLFALQKSAVIFADSGVPISIDVSSAALQLTVPSSASIELNPTSSSAVFGSTNLVINVATNNITGYTLSMSVPTTDLTHSTLSNTFIPTLENQTTEVSFPANTWGYKLIGDDYLPVATHNTPASWMVEEPTNGNSHTITLAAKVDGAKPSGDYANILTFQAVANPNAPRDTITYNGNGADSGNMATQMAYQGESVKLNPNAFTRSGYLFNGWNTAANGTGTGYGDEDNYTSKATISPINTTLYAQWVENTGGGGTAGRSLQAAYEQAYVYNTGAYYDSSRNTYKHGLYVPVKNPTTGEYTGEYFEATQESDYEGIPAKDLRFAIQDISLLVDGLNVCERATVVGSEAYVLDLRDNKSYWVAKMIDGRCWMTQNLDLDLTNGHTLTHDTSDIGWTTNDPTTTWNPVNTTIPFDIEGYVDRWAGIYVNSNYLPSSTDPGDSYVVTSGNNDDDTLYKSKQACIVGTSSTAEFCAHYHVGNYYNWTAAIAENNSETTELTTQWTIAPNSICPAGWRLPTGRSGSGDQTEQNASEYLSLLVKGNVVDDYNRQWYKNHSDSAFNAARTAPFYFVRAGTFEMYNQYQVKQNGLLKTAHYWAGSVDIYSYNATRLTFTGTYIYVNNDSRYAGKNIRCIAR